MNKWLIKKEGDGYSLYKNKEQVFYSTCYEKVIDEFTGNAKTNDWLIIKYKSDDWSVYLVDIDGMRQYQMTWKTFEEAERHCC